MRLDVYFDFLVDFDTCPEEIAWPCATLCAELEARAAYMLFALRGSCWKDENACGDAGPVGKKLPIGDDGGEV